MSDQDFFRSMPPLATKTSPLRDRFEYFSEHIVAISALATLAVALASTCMLFGFVFALDRDLLRLIQYSDVLQFGLETVVFLFLSSCLTGLFGVFFDLVRSMEIRRSIRLVALFLITNAQTTLFLQAFYVTSSNGNSSPWIMIFSPAFHVYFIIPYTFLSAVLLMRAALVGGPRKPLILILTGANMIIALIAVGVGTEEVIIETARPYDVTTTKQRFDEVILALTLGRGTVLYDRKARHTIVVREADITEIVPHKPKE
jgi:hypothetical protein